MAKKFGKILAIGAFLGAAVLGGIAYYKKSKDDSNSLDDDFDDFQDEFEDDEEEDFEDDFSSVDRGYVTIPKEHTDHMAEEIHNEEEAKSDNLSDAENGKTDEKVEKEDEDEDMLDDPDPDPETAYTAEEI